METYLFKISLKADAVWSPYSGKTIKPIYYVASSKESARKWAETNVKKGLSVKSISLMAISLATNVFSGSM